MNTPENSHNSILPRTWGREWFLIRDKEIQKKLTAYDLWSSLGILLAILSSFACGILSLIRLDGISGELFAYMFAMFSAMFTFIFYSSLKCMSYEILRPFYFSRLAKKTNGDRDCKMEAFKNTIPEPKYRVASFPPLNDAKQIRALLDSNRPLSRKQKSEAEAVLEAQAKAEEAEAYAKLAQAQIQTNSEAS